MKLETENNAVFVSKFCNKITKEHFLEYTFNPHDLIIVRNKEQYIILYNERETYFTQLFAFYRDDLEYFVTNYHRIKTLGNIKIIKELMR